MTQTQQKIETVTCHECALNIVIPELDHKQSAHCPRCGYTLTAKHNHIIDGIIATASATLVLLLASLPFDFLSFSSQGKKQQMDMLGSIQTLIENDYFSLALIQTVAIFIIPLLLITGFLYLLVPFRLTKQPPKRAHLVFNCVFALLPWAMVEIFLVGALVSLIKITAMADIELGKSFIAYCLFSISMVSMSCYIDKHQLQTLLNIPKKEHKPHKNSIQHTWALIITACICYIPANFLPIMNTRFLGQDEPSTILGGVVLLWEFESYFIASVIFIASVMIPIFKILILIVLNLSVQRKYHKFRHQRTTLYRITEIIGRWSMIDVFVVAILVSLVQLGNTMSILPGPAAIAFSAVVIITILAANTFDSTLIWLQKENNYE